MSEEIRPISGSDRITSLDTLRGIAILGILIMNITSFAMIEAAYANPMAVGSFSGSNKATWILSTLFADQKFMTLFSLLYGAGIWLFSMRLEERGIAPFKLFLSRSLWLLLIGLAHAYLFWYGDILVGYAVTGLVVYWFRHASPVSQVVAGLLMILVPLIFFLGLGLNIESLPDLQASIGTSWQPDTAAITKEVEIYQSGWLSQMAHRFPTALKFQTAGILVYIFWRAGGLMLIGMALMKWKILTGAQSPRFYMLMTSAGLSLGLLFGLAGIDQQLGSDFASVDSKFFARQWNYVGSLFMSCGYVGFVMAYIKPGLVSDLFAAAGRMAFTNYLGQTLICTLLFYGHGLGLFGTLERYQLVFFVLAIWAFQLTASSYWLARYRFGPMEWVWRSLTYWKPQRMKRA